LFVLIIKDELIRQVTVNCAERGLLLLRVRDEIRMTIQAYRTLYESSVAFGMRKALQAEQGKSEMEQQIRKLEKDLALQERAVKEWQAKCDAVEKKENERRKNDEKKFEEELSFLKKQNQQYKQELDRIMSLPQTKK
jgi:dynein light intermediate chain